MLKRFEAWLDSRTGYRALLHLALYENVPGGARWSYVFGSAVTVLILMQAATGVALELYYSPSTTDAWASVNYIQTQVWMGSLLRGVHDINVPESVSGSHFTSTFAKQYLLCQATPA